MEERERGGDEDRRWRSRSGVRRSEGGEKEKGEEERSMEEVRRR